MAREAGIEPTFSQALILSAAPFSFSRVDSGGGVVHPLLALTNRRGVTEDVEKDGGQGKRRACSLLSYPVSYDEDSMGGGGCLPLLNRCFTVMTPTH